MTKIPVYSLDYYNKGVVNRILEKYSMSQLDAIRAFLTSETHNMIEDPELAMWEFSERAVFDMWEAEQKSGDPRHSKYLRSECQ